MGKTKKMQNMKKDLNKRFKGRYSFLEKRLSEKEPYHSFGFQCGAGWGDLLERTFNLIQSRIDNPQYEQETFFTLKIWYNKTIWNNLFHPVGKFLFLRGIPNICPPEEAPKYNLKWDKYYKWQKFFCAHPRYVKPKYGLEFKILQCKQKFAGLRLYFSAFQKKTKWFGLITESKEDKYIAGIVALAESLSYSICEECGSNREVSQNKKGYILTLCSKCRKKREAK